MNKSAILHIPMSEYAHGISDDLIVFRLRAQKRDVQSVTLYYGDRACRNNPVDFFPAEMALILTDELFDWFEVTLHCPFKRVCYYFHLHDGLETALYYGDMFGDKLMPDRSEYFQLPYNHPMDRVDVPFWAKDAVVYNIFPDSFATSMGRISLEPTHHTWNGECCHGRLGGTIKGVMENLNYLENLGVNCIYLNPIFVAGEYHKYDLLDYYHIDPCLGTDEDFKQLVSHCHEKGIRVIIDGVFNHVGWRFFAFNDVCEKGRESRYWDWFFRLEEPVVRPEDMNLYPSYECFAYERMMPKTNTANPEVAAYFCDVGAYWVREYHIDGWRLDVASEVNDGFWRDFRKAVKTVNPHCLIIGEVWETAAHWLDGSMFDSTMNYDFRRYSKGFFAYRDMDALAFATRVNQMLMRYRKPVTYAQLNLLDSHDVSRFLSLCSEDSALMKLAVLFQMTFVGIPSVFYGDEMGLHGLLEDEYRRPMVFKPENQGFFAFYKKAIALRRSHEALRRGDFRILSAQKGSRLFVYSRDHITIAINAGDTPLPYTNPISDSLFQEGFADGILSKKGFIVHI